MILAGFTPPILAFVGWFRLRIPFLSEAVFYRLSENRPILSGKWRAPLFDGNPVTMTTADLQSQVAALLASGAFWDAAQLVSDAIADQGESSSLWNDWAVVQFTAGQLENAERALCRSLRLDPNFSPATENLGTLLFSQGKLTEAIPYLRQAHQAAKGTQRDILTQLIASCETGASPRGAGNV